MRQIASSAWGLPAYLPGMPLQTGLAAMGGWKSEKVMMNYIKATGKEFADQLKSYWEGLKST